MNLQENVPLAPLTTFGVGGRARFFIQAQTEKDIDDAIAFAKAKNLQLFVLGNGSNVLVPDVGVEGVVIKMSLSDIEIKNDSDNVLLIAGAGTQWEKVVDVASEHELFGIENLAGIPGTMGGAAVQNIGAYGAELSEVFDYADVIDTKTGEHRRITSTEAEFSYRTSFFKKHRELIVLCAALRLSKKTAPNLTYPDLKGITLRTPTEIAGAIRAIRVNKFPNTAEEGTAGSFFKNPIVDEEAVALLHAKYPELPTYPASAGGGSAYGGKISLAWLLDHKLSLKGFSQGNVRLYEKQPLIIVVRAGATATDVDAFANEIAERVFKETGIVIEREVEMFGTRK